VRHRTRRSTKFSSAMSDLCEKGSLALLDASMDLGDRWGSLPDAGSSAMAELAAEPEYEGAEPWGDEPVRQAHNMASLLLVGADDSARSACTLLSQERTPVYAHMVLARSTLELAGRAWLLVDNGIGIRLRIARGFNDRLYGLGQQDFLPLEGADKRRALERRTAVFAEGERLGFRKVRDRRNGPSLEEKRPTATQLVRRLLADGKDPQLGGAVYALFSAVAHGTTFGMSKSITLDAPETPTTPGVTWGAVYTSSRDVCSVLTAMILGIGTAFRARNVLFGWHADEWDHAYVDIIRRAKESLGF
jgi:hypothetical protein